MIVRVLRVAAVLMVGLGLVTACGSSDRPREISMDDVKPCELVSRSDVDRVEIRAEPQSRDSVSGVDVDGSTCYYNPFNRSNVWVSGITNHGIGRWTNSSFEDARSQEIARIQGFRAIKVWFDSDRPDPDHRCRVYVDVAGGQSLRVQVDESFREEDPPTCTTARRFAEAAMKSLAH